MSYDISKIYCDFSKVPEGVKITEHFSELGAFVEFDKCDEQRIKIAILMGDIDSPFVRIKDRDIMVSSIFEFLNISTKNKNGKKLMDDVIVYKDDLTMQAWLRYIQILHETDFTDWLLAKKDYDYFLKKSTEDKLESETELSYLKRRNENRKTIKELGEEVKAIEAKIFPDSKAAREAAVTESKNKIKLYAEMNAEAFTYI